MQLGQGHWCRFPNNRSAACFQSTLSVAFKSRLYRCIACSAATVSMNQKATLILALESTLFVSMLYEYAETLRRVVRPTWSSLTFDYILIFVEVSRCCSVLQKHKYVSRTGVIQFIPSPIPPQPSTSFPPSSVEHGSGGSKYYPGKFF